MGTVRGTVMVCAWALCGCRPAALPTDGKDSTQASPPSVIDIQPGSDLASVPFDAETLDPPHDWVPGLPGIFPSRAAELSETWGFRTGYHCRAAHYDGDIGALHADHPKWTELATLFAQAPDRTTAEIDISGTTLFAQRMFVTSENLKAVSVSVCTPTPNADRLLITTALFERIPALRGHDALLSQGYVSAVDYTRSIPSRVGTAVVAWLVGDAAARHSWQTLLRDRGLVKGESFESTSPLRTYALEPRGPDYELEVRGRLE